jgi:2'-5' RNA ligase
MSGGEHLIRGSLWLRPSGPVLERLQELIRRLTARFGGQWPKPHVALLNGIELQSEGAEARLEALCQRLQPITIRLGQLEGRNDPFRCFYAAVEVTPELMDAHRAACETFNLPQPDTFEPHLSLLYGHVDAPTKARLAKELGGRLILSFVANSVHLVNATAAIPVARWHTLHECPVRRAGRQRPQGRSLSASR